MNKKTKDIIQSRIALLLLAVFISSLLIKPFHTFFSEHQHVEETITIEYQHKISTNHYVYCAVLDFEFCTFIPQKQINTPNVSILNFEKLTFETTICLADNSVHLFQLRAPPAV